MAYRPVASEAAQRERREQSWLGAASISDKFPRAGRFALELHFADPAGALTPSPFRQLYEPSMQAFFDLRCPLHDCAGGGFHVNDQITAMLANPKLPRTGTATCAGTRTRSGVNQPCGLKVTFRLAADD